VAHDVFISHAIEDTAVANAVRTALEAEGMRCWIAPRDVPSGVSHAEAVDDAISESSLMVLVFSSRSNNCAQVMNELESAARRFIPLLPFRVEDVLPSKSMRFLLSSVDWLDALRPRLEEHLHRLAGMVEALLAMAEPEARGRWHRAIEEAKEDFLTQNKASLDALSTRLQTDAKGGSVISQPFNVLQFSAHQPRQQPELLDVAHRSAVSELIPELTEVIRANEGALARDLSDALERTVRAQAGDPSRGPGFALGFLDSLRQTFAEWEEEAAWCERQSRFLALTAGNDVAIAIADLRRYVQSRLRAHVFGRGRSRAALSNCAEALNEYTRSHLEAAKWAAARHILVTLRGGDAVGGEGSVTGVKQLLKGNLVAWGKEAFAAGDWLTAIARFGKADRFAPGDAEIKRLLAASHYNHSFAQGLGNEWFSFFHRRPVSTDYAPAPRAPKAPRPPDHLYFTVTAPHLVRPRDQFVINVWAHLARQRELVIRQAREAAAGEIVAQPKGPVEVARGAVLSVQVRVEGIIIEELEDTVLWSGEIANATFVATVPHRTRERRRVGVATVRAGGLRIAEIPFVITVGRVSDREAVSHEGDPLRTAFASYASGDRDAVLDRVQGMQKVAPQLEVFLDVLKLRSGEDWAKKLWKAIPEHDVFYLFWSRSASRSEWVEKEWRCALKTRGLDFIDPVPLVSPENVPPPRELASKHFNDWVLAFKRGERQA
jgi:hypothetical protein